MGFGVDVCRRLPGGATAITGSLLALHHSAPTEEWRRSRSEELEPLERVVVYRAEDHFHYVSYGLSSQAGTPRASIAPGLSGFGFELSMRIRRNGAHVPPQWPAQLLQMLARYVIRSGNAFRPGDHVALREPIAQAHHIGALLLAQDLFLPDLPTESGLVRFIQVIGITLDELTAVKSWSSFGFLELLRSRDPMLITDPLRGSLLLEPAFREACRRGARIEGSAQSAAFVPSAVARLLPTGVLELELPATAVEDLVRALRGRLPFNRDFVIRGRQVTIRLVPDLAPGWRYVSGELVVGLPWDAASQMAETLIPQRGTYTWPQLPRLAVTIRPTDVRGHHGEVIRVIG